MQCMTRQLCTLYCYRLFFFLSNISHAFQHISRCCILPTSSKADRWSLTWSSRNLLCCQSNCQEEFAFSTDPQDLSCKFSRPIVASRSGYFRYSSLNQLSSWILSKVMIQHCIENQYKEDKKGLTPLWYCMLWRRFEEIIETECFLNAGHFVSRLTAALQYSWEIRRVNNWSQVMILEKGLENLPVIRRRHVV